MPPQLKISLVIPVFNESGSIKVLIETIQNQSRFPDEIVLVDGGSTDNTVEIARSLVREDKKFKIISEGRAMPGKGRNIGVKHAQYEWVAFTDAGIKLDRFWLENLELQANLHEGSSIVYGNFSPQINSFFDKCAAISYVTPLKPNDIRGKSIVSYLVRKEVIEQAGGFPDWRAAEDLEFMENAEKTGCRYVMAPAAIAKWELRQGLIATYKKFELYSKYNVWAGRQRYWHYGVARQYAIMAIPCLLGVFHSLYWLLLFPIWIMARTAKRILLHRHEFGIKTLFNPGIFLMVMLLTLIIDVATFAGWINAVMNKNRLNSTVSNA